MERRLTCIRCPFGCRLVVQHDDNSVTAVEGNRCRRGKEYAAQEILEPMRTVTTTVKVKGGSIPLVPVKTLAPVPKDMTHAVVKKASLCSIPAPVRTGEVICDNIAGTGVALVATRDIPEYIREETSTSPLSR